MKRYLLIFWQGENDEDGHFKEIECLLSDETRSKLLSTTPPKFIDIIINDGEEMLILTDNISNFTQIYKKESLVL